MCRYSWEESAPQFGLHQAPTFQLNRTLMQHHRSRSTSRHGDSMRVVAEGYRDETSITLLAWLLHPARAWPAAPQQWHPSAPWSHGLLTHQQQQKLPPPPGS